jgi:hypothetical protein
MLWERMEIEGPESLFAISIQDILQMPDVEAEDIVNYVKGSKFRSQPEGEGQPYMIADVEAGVFRSVQPAEQMYVEWTKEDLQESMQDMMGQMPEGYEAEDDEGSAPTVRPLGKTRSINGFRCEAYEVRTRDKLIWAWVTEDHPDAMRAFERMAEGVKEMDPMAESENDPEDIYLQYGLPILTQEVGMWDGELSDQYDIEEVVSIERESVPDSMFEVPAGFRKMTMQDMMKGMMQQPQQR